MPERPDHDMSHPAEVPLKRRFPRTFLGYRRRDVDDAVTRLELQVHELEEQAVTLREELLDARHEASETRHDLTRARAELRYWNDRASYVDSEVARARQRAKDLEESARARAEAIEADAQERSLQLVDRVCAEANAMLQHAREEAREMFLRFETDVDLSHQKLEKLEKVRAEVARTMQGALQQFEEAVRELDSVAPHRRIAETLEPPVRRAIPTFGKQKAIDAARRFEDSSQHEASAALSTPLLATVVDEEADVTPETGPESATGSTASEAPVSDETRVMPGLSVDDPIPAAVGTAGDVAAAGAGEGGAGEADQRGDEGQSRREHAADDEFASLLR